MTAPLPTRTLSIGQLQSRHLHAALDRSQQARRAQGLADTALATATSAFDTGLDERVDSPLLRLLDADLAEATATHALAVRDTAESEAGLLGAAARPAGAGDDRPPRHHRAVITADPSAIARIRTELRHHLAGTVDDELLGDIELMASEVAGNCLRFDAPVVIGLEVDVDRPTRRPATVTVTVSGGHAAASPALIRPPAAADAEAQTGRGLEILDALANVWGTQRRHRRTSVWFSVTTVTPVAAPVHA